MKKYIVLASIAIVLLIATILNWELTVGDELWNFQNTYKIYQGYVLYEDCNVIITPLFFYIRKGFFKLIRRKLFGIPNLWDND